MKKEGLQAIFGGIFRPPIFSVKVLPGSYVAGILPSHDGKTV